MLGVGLTMEGIENNPVMYELLCELPWRPEHFSKDEWLQGYLRARYGRIAPKVEAAGTVHLRMSRRLHPAGHPRVHLLRTSVPEHLPGFFLV